MKNIHVIPTDKPSRLHLQNGNLVLHRLQYTLAAQHIYITSDEIVTEYSTSLYFIDVYTGKNYVFSPIKIDKESIHAAPFHSYMNNGNMCKRIIMTTDPILISNGIQSVDDEFLEWFVKNSSCEEVEVKHYNSQCRGECGICDNTCGNWYKIIVPKEEPKQDLIKFPLTPDECYKQETLEEAYKRIFNSIDYVEFDFPSFKFGAKWQAEKRHSEEEVLRLWNWLNDGYIARKSLPTREELIGWFEQFKKK